MPNITNNMCTIYSSVTLQISVENAKEMVESLQPEVDIILDAIDGTSEKAALIAASCLANVTVVTVGGAAGRVDPTLIVCDDLSRSSECRLLFWTKKQLRDTYKLFPKGPLKKGVNLRKIKVKKWKIWAVYSEEVQKRVEKDESSSSFRTCDGSLGTACFVTGTYGFVAASKVVSMLANQELIKPKILKSALYVEASDSLVEVQE